MAVASISISGEITLNLHSLNNEGGEGNQIMTRQLTIIDRQGIPHTVTGISGDMFKHIHVGHLINLAQAKEENLPLCTNCKIFNPNRLSTGEDLAAVLEVGYVDADVIEKINEMCVVDDAHGVLVTNIGGTNKNVPRKSIVEFGWTVGIPGKNNTESYIHAKYVSDAGTKTTTATNEGQNIFHRPANHGVYAFVCSIEAYRIGFNDITREYANVNRKERYKALVQSLLSSIINPKGAMTSTQKPHITDFKGVVAVSSTPTPAPTISALYGDNYREEIKTIGENLNRIDRNAITLYEFNGLGELSKILADLAEQEPYELSANNKEK